eukprot:TRINITY_DN266_c0_g1_i2.p2 TRINITY_DN266_c0_g1~~TRINITY_DN266_c0_g1_i2.p2  ORF type:complete len:175 (+),score=37.24 TRINITY_DN266_c0_g1_i2:82-606(+)
MASVSITPSVLDFSGGATRTTSTLTTTAPIVFKVMTNKPDNFTVKPRFGVLDAGKSVKLLACLNDADVKVRGRVSVRNVAARDVAVFELADETARKAIWEKAAPGSDHDLTIASTASPRSTSTPTTAAAAPVHPVVQTLLSMLPEQLDTLLVLKLVGGAWFVGLVMGWWRRRPQ